MASFKITDLTELASGSVADTDVLEIVDLDQDQSKKVTIASLKTVFAGGGVSEGDSYTGGTANGIMFNDGDTFATSSNLVFDGANVGIGTTSPTTGRLQIVDSDVSSGGRTPLELQTSTGVRIFSFYNANSNTTPVPIINGFNAWCRFYNGISVRKQNSGGGDILNLNNYLNAKKFGFDRDGKFYINRTSGDATIHATNLTDIVAHRIDLSNGQTADAFQINSYGNTGGDLFKVEDDGKIVLGNDVTLYRSEANLLAIDDAVRIASQLGIGLGLSGTPDFNLDVAADSNPYVNARFKGLGDEGLFIGAITTAYQYVGGNSYYRNSNQWTPKDTGASSIIFDDGEIIFNSNTGLTVDVDFVPTEIARINTTGVGIGTTSLDASAKFQIDSTTQGVLLPRMTTTQRNAIASPANGLLIYNTTDNQFQYYNSGIANWAAV